MAAVSLDVAALQAAYASGQLSPAQLVADLYPRWQAATGVFLHLQPLEALLARCAQLEALPAAGRGPLWGVPFAVKDNVDVAGAPTTAACAAFSYVPAESAPAVQALDDAGAARAGGGWGWLAACGHVGGMWEAMCLIQS